ncbi:MAG: tetratricopeptide repeat protein [Treponema sp.]|jgi:Flp pilus assembly protein TadD|nr:tetratricopeptide repeat protein [Treponema sp.]
MIDEPNRIVYIALSGALKDRLDSFWKKRRRSHAGRSHVHGGGGPEDAAEKPPVEDFSLDPSIPIPVELPAGKTMLKAETLSSEQILSGMIRVICDPPLDLEFSLEGAGTGNKRKLNWGDIEYYRRFVLALKPNIDREFTDAAILKAENGEYDLALEICSALAGLFPESPFPRFNRAVILENQAKALESSGREADAESRFELAQTAWEDLLKADTPFDLAFFNAGKFFMYRRNFARARECFTSFVSLSNDTERKAEAEAAIGEISKSGLDDALFKEAYDCIRMGREQEGLLKIREFLTIQSTVWNAWFLLGWALRRLGRWEDGAAAFRKALELGADNSDTLNELAICLMEGGDLKNARRELEKALWKDPDSVKIISNLGVLALKNGDDDEAAGFFRTVLELAPDDPVARSYLETRG